MTTMPNDLISLPTMPYDMRPASMPLDVEECRTAIWIARGNISKAAEMLKISSMRLRTFVKNSPRLSAEQKEAQEQLLDIAEDVAFEALTDAADTGRQDQMARFVMSNLGRERGYGQGNAGINLNMPKGGRMTISWDDGTSIIGEAPSSDENTIEGEAVRG